MIASSKVLSELVKCFNCNCQTKPICTINGTVCKECMDNHSMLHRLPEYQNYGKFSNSTINDQSLTSTQTGIEIVPSEKNGDCLFECFHNALGVEIHDLRYLFAIKQTLTTFEVCKELKFIDPIFVTSLDEFRVYLLRQGRIHGSDKCRWGDENALHIFSDEYRINIVIYNIKTHQFIQSISPSEDRIKQAYLLLNLCDEHYELIRFNGKSVVLEDDYKEFIKVFDKRI